MADPDELLGEQIAYYRAVAGEYEEHAIGGGGEAELLEALEAFAPRGRVLELASGPGAWTERLLRHASHVTAVDAAPEMIARARARVGDARARFIQADLFSWQPDEPGSYDVVFHGFWISHVPIDRFARFWSMVAAALAPGGRVFFADDNFRTKEELIEGAASATIERKLLDGTAFRAVKVPWDAAELESELRALGWDIEVRQTAGPFYWGAGRRA